MSSQDGADEIVLLRQYGLSEEQYSQKVSDPHVDIISRSHCESWRSLYSHLELEEIVVSDTDKNYGLEAEKRRGFFSVWRTMKGSDATYQKLVYALLKTSARQDAESVCKLLAESLGIRSPKHSMSEFSPGALSTSPTPSASFPYLDGVPKQERAKLEARLRRESENMTKVFAKLVFRTKKALDEEGIEASDVELLFKNTPSFKKAYNAVKGSKNLGKLILKLSDYWSFFDFEILSMIIECQCTNLIPDLREYEESFKSYCQRRLCEVPEGTMGVKMEEEDFLCLKCDKNFSYEKSKLWDVKVLTNKLSELLGTRLILRHIKKGCLELAVTALSDALSPPVSDAQREQIKQVGVVRIFSMYECYELQEKSNTDVVGETGSDSSNPVPGPLLNMELGSEVNGGAVNFNWKKTREKWRGWLIRRRERQHFVLLSGSFSHIVSKILSYLDAKSLCRAEQVCSEWYYVVADGLLWKKLVERRVSTDSVWRRLSKRKELDKSLFHSTPQSDEMTCTNYKQFYQTIHSMQNNWKSGRYKLSRIKCDTNRDKKGSFCMQFDEKRIVSGHRDNTVKVWDRQSLECIQILQGHTGTVRCLQYSDNLLITGSVDRTIKIWDLSDGKVLNTLNYHNKVVTDLRFKSSILITCSKDSTIAVWDMKSPEETSLKRVLVGHGDSVTAVDFDDRYIVSGSTDAAIKLWGISSYELIATFDGHQRTIQTLQIRGKYVVSGSSDCTIRIWDMECRVCLRILEGFTDIARTLGVNDQWIVSGDYDGAIKVWDFQAALDPNSQVDKLCLWTSVQHTGSVLNLQFDDSQIVSTSADDTILIWDFLDVDDELTYPQLKCKHKLKPPTGQHGSHKKA